MIVRIESARQSYIYGSAAPRVTYTHNTQFVHHGVKGQKWGVRRYQNYDGTWKDAKHQRGYDANEKYKKLAKSNKQSDRAKAYQFLKENKKDIKVGRKMDRVSARQNKSANKGEANLSKGKTTGKAIRRTVLLGAAAAGSGFLARHLLKKGIGAAFEGNARKAGRGIGYGVLGVYANIGLKALTALSAGFAIKRGIQNARAKDRAAYEGRRLK